MESFKQGELVLIKLPGTMGELYPSFQGQVGTVEFVSSTGNVSVDVDGYTAVCEPSWISRCDLRIVSRVTLPRKANEYGEWIVKAYDQNGERYPQADYHASDKQDAIGTAKLMTARKA